MGESLLSEHARALAAQRRRGPRTCLTCGTSFVGIATARYCSNACRVRAYQDRNRDTFNARRREHYRRKQEAKRLPVNPKGDVYCVACGRSVPDAQAKAEGWRGVMVTAGTATQGQLSRPGAECPTCGAKPAGRGVIRQPARKITTVPR